MIITVTLTPALDKTAVIPGFSPGAVNRVRSLRLDPGGKGINVSRVLRRLGDDSLAVGILAGGTGRYIESRLREEGVACDFVQVPGETRTNLKITDPERGVNTDINEPGTPAGPETLEEVYRRAARAAGPGDIVVLAGKAPPGAPETLFADWIARFRALGARAYLDVEGPLLARGIDAGPALAKPNDAELSRLLGRTIGSPPEAAAAARELTARGAETVVVSMGAAGAVFVREGEALHIPGVAVPVQSTVGAGDSMVAALAHGEARGLPFREACALSVAVSAAAAAAPGTQPPDLELVRQLLPRVRVERLS